MNNNITEENKEAEMRKAFNLLEVLNEKGVDIGHFGIDYDNKTLQLNSSDINSVNTHDDLKNWLKDFK